METFKKVWWLTQDEKTPYAFPYDIIFTGNANFIHKDGYHYGKPYRLWVECDDQDSYEQLVRTGWTMLASKEEYDALG